MFIYYNLSKYDTLTRHLSCVLQLLFISALLLFSVSRPADSLLTMRVILVSPLQEVGSNPSGDVRGLRQQDA